MLLLLAVCTFTSLVILSYYSMKFSKTAQQINVFPGPEPLPIVGNLLLAAGKIEDFQKKSQAGIAKYGSLVRLWIGSKPYLLIGDGKAAEMVLRGSGNLQKADFYSAFHRVLKDSLLTAPPEKWKKDRKNISRGFMSKQHEGFLTIFHEQAQKLMAIIRKVSKNPENLESGHHFLPYFARCTLDSVFQTTFGSIQDTQGQLGLGIVEMMRGCFATTREKLLKPYLNGFPMWRLFGHWKLEETCIQGLMDFTEKIILEKNNEKKEIGEVKGTHTRPFLAYLMDATDDRKDIAFQTNLLSFGAADSSATALNYLLYLLALYPECQEKVVQEVDSILGLERNRKLSLDELKGLTYTEMCVKEALRLFPPIPMFSRSITTPVVLDSGKIIPKGTQAVIIAYEVHRKPEVYPEPESFIPERFDGSISIPTGSWIPFSYGPRNCLGSQYAMIQLKTLAVHFFKNFTVKTSTRRQELNFIYGVILEHNPPIRLILEERNFNKQTEPFLTDL